MILCLLIDPFINFGQLLNNFDFLQLFEGLLMKFKSSV